MRPSRRTSIQHYGIGCRADWSHWFGSVDHLASNFATFRPPRRPPEAMIGETHITDAFLAFDGPKVFFSQEPWFVMNEDARTWAPRHVGTDQQVGWWDPDPQRRWYFTCLPPDPARVAARLRRRRHLRRPEQVCMVNRWATRDFPESLVGARLDLVHAFGDGIDVYGRVFPNEHNGWVDYPNYRGFVADKAATIRRYTFVSCFENSDYDGYVTEKLPQAVMGGCVPLYWGGGNWIDDAIPPECYVDCRDRDPTDVVDEVRTMSFERIVAYREAGIRWLESPAARRFTREHFADQVIERFRAQGLDR